MGIPIEIKLEYLKIPFHTKSQSLETIDLTIIPETHCEIKYNFLEIYSDNSIDIIALSKKISQLPGMSRKDFANEFVKKSNRQDLLATLFSNENMVGNLKVLLHMLFLFSNVTNDIYEISEHTISFLQNNIYIEYSGELGRALPVIYFIPLETSEEIKVGLFNRGFLVKYSIQYTNPRETTKKYENYYKPGTTPNPSLFLNGKERIEWNAFMKSIDLKLRRLTQ